MASNLVKKILRPLAIAGALTIGIANFGECNSFNFFHEDIKRNVIFEKFDTLKFDLFNGEYTLKAKFPEFMQKKSYEDIPKITFNKNSYSQLCLKTFNQDNKNIESEKFDTLKFDLFNGEYTLKSKLPEFMQKKSYEDIPKITFNKNSYSFKYPEEKLNI